MAYLPPSVSDYKRSVRVVATTNVSLAAPGATLDGESLSVGDRVLLVGQTTASQNGIWIWNGAASAMTRAVDADSEVELNTGAQVTVEEGTTENIASVWVLQTPGPIVVGTTALSFTRVGGPGQPGMPPGILAPYAGIVAPTGWLLCYGQFVLQSEFPTLFASVGHTYNGGVDPGNGTFKIPDLRGRSIFGKDNMGGTAASRLTSNGTTLGGTGGVESALVALNEMPSHTHGGTTGTESADHSHSGSTGTVSSDHAHGFSEAVRNENSRFINTTSGTSYRMGFSGVAATGGINANHTHAFTTGGRSAAHTHSFTTGVPTGYGSQTALSKLAPFMVANVIISTGETYVAPENVAEMIPRSVLGSKGNILVATGTGAEGVIAPPALNQMLLGDPSTGNGWKLHTGPRPNMVEWTTLPLVANQYGHYASPYGGVSYMKDAEGTVFIRGLAEILPGALTTLVATLPVGCRPGRRLLLALATSNGGDGVPKRFDIDTDGNIYQPSMPVGTWFSLTMSFKAEG